MDIKFSKKKHSKSIVGKIIFTCLLAFAAISLSLYISKITFSRILSTVDQLAKPNEKIELVNNLFRDVVKLDQLQRNQGQKTAADQYNPFLKQSHKLQVMLDSLRYMSLQNPAQVIRIDSMKEILYKRNMLFLKYLRLRADIVKNDTLATQVKNLSELIEKAGLRTDSNLVTTSRATKTIIDTLKQEDEKQSLWNRIFTKKKPKQSQVKTRVEEELHVRIDTLAINNRADSLTKMSNAISQVEMNRVENRALLTKKHAELYQAGDMLIAQLMDILTDIERDELLHDTQENILANSLVNKSMVNINAVLIVFILGTVILIFLIFTDISRSNKYRKQLVIAKEEAEEAGLVKQRFLANMSHELRTPLQTIIGISEQVRTVQRPRPQDLENIYQSSLHLLQIVNEVLDYSRIISGKYTLENKPFNMFSLLNEVKEMIQVQLLLKNLTFHYDSSIEETACYSGDSFRLKQVLLNLLGNAVKFTDTGSISLSVTENKQAGNTSSFTFIIQDTGIGMSAEDLGVVFNQFEQGSNSHKQQGTGLGLSIVKAIVDIQHGDIQVQSEPGKGTVFTLTMPLEKTEAIVVPESVRVPPLLTGYSGHIWVVDDDMFILQLCDTILNKHSIPHTCFSSSQQALATPFPPGLSIVFLDIRMAEMDGITLCRKLRERNVSDTPKYIALTAQALPDEREAILQQGVDGLVMKPFLEQDFINAVNEHTPVPLITNRPFLDLSAIYKMTGDDEEMMDMVLQSFVTETEKDITAANKSITENDSYGFAEALHKLACRYGQLGATPLAHKLRSMEIALRNQAGIDEVIETMDAVHDDIAAVITVIKELLSKRMFLQNVEKTNIPPSYIFDVITQEFGFQDE